MSNLLNIVDERKIAYYKTMKSQRDNFEPRIITLVRKTLDEQYKDLIELIDVTNYKDETIVSVITEEPIKKLFVTLYTSIGVFFALQERRRQKSQVISFAKENPDKDEYIKWLENYVISRLGKKITSITGESRKQALKIIQKVIGQGMIEGWGAEQIARAVRKALEGIEVINQWRAVRIARTETASASNIGSYVGAQDFAKETGIRLQKYWIATYDEKTRDTHLVMEQQNPKELNEPFLVAGVWPAECPMDPDLPAEETINCRCTIAFKAVL